MKFKNSKGADITASVARGLETQVPDFDDPDSELPLLGLTEDQVKTLKVRYEQRAETEGS